MRCRIPFLVCLFIFIIRIVAGNDLEGYFLKIKQLKFGEATAVARLEKNKQLQGEMLQLAFLLEAGGQRDSNQVFQLAGSVREDKVLKVFRFLNAGYHSLFYNQRKGNAFRSFYDAYRIANDLNDPVLVKACAYAFLKYYRIEIAQNSDAYLPYLKKLESLQSDTTDDLWVTVYKLIFYSKSIEGLDQSYFLLSAKLAEYEKTIEITSPLLAYVYYEKALTFYLKNDLKNASIYYGKTVEQSGEYTFLNTERFLSLLKLTLIAMREKNFLLAKSYFDEARHHVNKADPLRSDYYLNINHSLLMNAEGKNDSAFQLLKTAYEQDFKLDFRRNTLEINRLSVELETQEKEFANLQLRQNRVVLLFALFVAAIVCLIGYFAYANLRSKNMVQEKEREVQAMKLEKVLKEQELFGIDSMIEGQEKERQRIANDLHDHLGSLLATIKLHFQNIKMADGLLEKEQGVLIGKTDLLIEEAYQKVRTIAHAKNAGVNAQDGLLPAVKHFAAKVSIMNKLVIEVEEHGMDRRLENSFEITLFRIIQELITNVIKHSQATEVTIHLTQHDDSINVMVEDNGKGFELSQIKQLNSMGLYTIQKRIENLGGRVSIDSIIEKGTAVIIDVPIV